MSFIDYHLPLEIIQRIKKENRKIKMQEMRAALPTLTLDEIRKMRMDFSDAVQLEASEAGYPSTANFIKELIAYQEDILATSGKNNIMWYKNRLKKSRPDLTYLKDILIKAEDCHYKGNLKEECEHWIILATHYGFGKEFKEWDWLADQLFLQSVALSANYPDSRKYEALSKYFYAYFLMSTVNVTDYHFSEIEELLLSAKELSSGQSWTTEDYLPTFRSANLYTECNYTLYKIYIENAKKIYKSNPRKAGNLSYKAKVCAAAACYPKGRVEALIIQGLTYFILRNATTAISCLYHAINLKLRSKEVEDECLWRKIYEILDHFRNGRSYLGITALTDFKELVYFWKLDIPLHIRNIFKYLGFFCLMKREPFSASRFLSLALYEMNYKKYYDDGVELLAYMAMSTALILYSEYVRIINNSHFDSTDLKKLVMWKGSRTKFWPKEIKCSLSEIWDDFVLQKEAHRKEHKLLFTVITQEELDMFERTIGPLLQHRRCTAISLKRHVGMTTLVLPLYKTSIDMIIFEDDDIDISDINLGP